MNDTVKEKLAESLTSNTTDILPYLPYLLQDFWELGSHQNKCYNYLKNTYLLMGIQKFWI